jgi:hypothetical protein
MMNAMQKLRPLILAGLTMITAFNSLHAQEKKKGYSEEVTVTAPYEPSVTDANKISFQPKVTDTAIHFQKQNYLIRPFLMQTSVSIKPLDPARVSGESPKPLFRNYLKGGLGTTSSPYAEFFASSAGNTNHLITVHLKHLSSKGAIHDQWFPGFSENMVELSGKLFTDLNVISLSGSYNRDVNHFYAPKLFKGTQLREPTEDSLRQQFGLIKASFELKSRTEEEDALKYGMKLDIAHLNDYYKTSELNIHAAGMIQKSTDWLTFTDHQYFGIDLSIDHNTLNNTAKDKTATLIELFPSYRFLFNEYQITMGLKTDFDLDSTSHLNIYPNIEARVQLVPDRLTAQAGISGGLNRYNFNALRLTNPFISSLTGVVTSNEKFNIFASIKGNIAQRVDLEARFESKIIDNMPLFVNDTIQKSHQRRFNVITDDVNLIRILFSARYNGDDFHIKLQGNWNNYSPNTEKYAWNCPDIEAQLEAGVVINEQWSVNTQIFTWGDSYAKTWNLSNVTVAKKLKGATDINFGINYHPANRFNVFLNLNNVLNKNYERWNLYPSFGFNAMAGVSFSF